MQKLLNLKSVSAVWAELAAPSAAADSLDVFNYSNFQTSKGGNKIIWSILSNPIITSIHKFNYTTIIMINVCYNK